MLSLGNLFNSVDACGDHVFKPPLAPRMRQKRKLSMSVLQPDAQRAAGQPSQTQTALGCCVS